jgi:hypothetical protein
MSAPCTDKDRRARQAWSALPTLSNASAEIGSPFATEWKIAKSCSRTDRMRTKAVRFRGWAELIAAQSGKWA